MFAHEESARQLRRALELVDPGEPAAVHAHVLVQLGQAEIKSGRTRRGREALLEAAAVARASGDRALLARAAVAYAGRGEVATRSDRPLVGLLEEALAAADDEKLRVRLLGRLAMALYFTEDLARAQALAGEGLALARRLGDPATLAFALQSSHYVLWGPDHADERLATAGEIIELADRIGSDEVRLAGSLWLLCDRLERGEPTRALAAFGEYTRTAERLRQPFHLWRTEVLRGTLAIASGRFAEGESRIASCLEMASRVDSENPAFIAGIQLYWLRRDQGRLDELEGIVRAGADENPHLVAWRSGLALLHAEVGRRDEARAIFESIAAGAFARVPRDTGWLNVLDEQAQVAFFLGDRARARELYDLLRPHAAQSIVVGMGDFFDGSVARALGTLATLLGRFDRAERHFEDAVRVNSALGARPALARTRHRYALMLLARGGKGDQRRAAELLDEAAAAAREIGMAKLAADVARALPATRAAAMGTSVLERDGDEWVVAGSARAFRLRDSKGLRYLDYLLRHPGREVHAIELALAVEEESGDAVPGRSAAPPPLDPAARSERAETLASLRSELDDATAMNDGERAARLRERLEAEESEVARLLGVSGGARLAGSAAERARINLTRTIRDALARITAADPALGRRLRQSVRTGTFFCFSEGLSAESR